MLTSSVIHMCIRRSLILDSEASFPERITAKKNILRRLIYYSIVCGMSGF